MSGRIETWTPGVGWLPGGARVTELFPPSCAPVTAELVARMGIPAEDVREGPVAR
jgi:hypothetical protein